MKNKLRNDLNRWLIENSRVLLTSKVWGYPTSLMVEPTNFCNLSCLLCPTGAGWLKHPQGKMELDSFYKVMDEVGPYLDRVAFWNWGEPFLHKQLLEMVKYTKRWPIWVQVSTNGHSPIDQYFANEIVMSGIDQITISVDGLSTESIQKYRGPKSDLKKIINFLDHLVNARLEHNTKKPIIEAQFLVMSHNLGEIVGTQKMLIGIGVDRFFCKTINMKSEDLEKYSYLLPDVEKYNRFRLTNNNNWSVRGIPGEGCSFVYKTAVMLWDGSITPCCFDAEEAIILGNAFQEGFWHSWNSRKFIQFRKTIRNDRKRISICSWCPENRMSENGKNLDRFWTNLDP